MVSTVVSQQEGCGFDPGVPGPFCVDLVHSPRVCVASLRLLQLLQLPPTTQRHACNANPKLDLVCSSAATSVKGCRSLCGPEINWQLVRVATPPLSAPSAASQN